MVPDVKRLHGWTDFRGISDFLVPSGAETRCGLSLMDQERDTIGNDKSSQRKRFWRENPPLDLGSGGGKRDNRPIAEGASKGFHEIPAADSPPMSEPLPILFELPDRTPEAVRKRKESPQFSLHNAHAGPPASHVDPPSGNHSHLVHTGPTSPAGSDSIDADSDTSDVHGDPRLMHAPHGETLPEDDHKVAAYHDETMSWSENAKSSWVVRSAVVFLMLAMVTLAFFSGRGLRPSGPQTGESLLSETDSGSVKVDESVVVMIDDIATLEDLASATGNASATDYSSDSPGQEILDAIANLPPDESAFPAIPMADLLPEAFQQPADADLPSYIADSSKRLAAGTLGQPSASAPHDDAVSGQTFPTVDIAAANSGVPAIAPSAEAVVAFRTPEQNGIENGVRSNDLPSGMNDRLKLEDGLRYSGTPYPIGNFLEILQAWEASASQ